ncbi:DNA-directed RNA polymerase I subunit RPA43 [Marchantia polymorpha subsp. ruderalis]
MEGMTVVHAKIGVFLHPSRAANVRQGVHEILNSLLLKFNEEFDGVVLGYLKPKIIGQSARILAGLTPYFHVNLTAKLLIFSPSPGMLIEGKVNKIEKDYIGVVVLGLFNAAIGVSDIREDLYYDENPQGRAWVSESDERHSIRLGSTIRFAVKSLQETEHIIDLCGSLADPKTGCVNWIELPSLTPRKKSKSKSAEDRSTHDADRKHKTPKKEKLLLKSEGSSDANDVGTALKTPKEEHGVHNSYETPHSNDVARKVKTPKSERDHANSFETPDVYKKKKRGHVLEEPIKPMVIDLEPDVMPTPSTSSGHKHKKRKEAESVQTPDGVHHKKKKKRRDVVDTV